MEYEKEDKKKKGKPGRKEFKEDITEAIKNAKGKKKEKRGGWKKIKRKKKVKASRYDDMSAKELYQLVKQKRDMILGKKGIPAKIPRGKAALKEICKKIKK